MELFQLKKVKTKKVKRVGRGPGSGHGKTSCRGHKGTGQRKGRMYYVGFLGGNVPYLRKIPKRGFNPPRRREYQIVNLKDIVKKLNQLRFWQRLKKSYLPFLSRRINFQKKQKS